MRLPRPRLRLRTLLILVAAVGVLLGSSRWVEELRSRSALYRQKAATFGRRSIDLAGIAAEIDGLADQHEREGDSGSAGLARWEADRAAETRAKAEHYARLSRKYLHAADRPWEPLPPDPPPPP